MFYFTLLDNFIIPEFDLFADDFPTATRQTRPNIGLAMSFHAGRIQAGTPSRHAVSGRQVAPKT